MSTIGRWASSTTSSATGCGRTRGPSSAVPNSWPSTRSMAKGLRDAIEHVVSKPEGLTRILVLGDSFAFGVGGNYDVTWPVLFERRLLAQGYSIDVIKAGVPATTPALRCSIWSESSRRTIPTSCS
jgi:hypothetical protein